MNRVLMEQIVRHIFANLGMIHGEFVDFNKTTPIVSKEFLLSDRLSFRDDQGKTIQNKVWGCQISVDQSEIKMLVGNCSQDPQLPEYCLIFQLKNSPVYGLYLVYSDHLPPDQQVDSEVMLAFSMDGKNWMECGTYLQATFLAGMEQIRDIGLGYSKCQEYKTQFELMESFLNFHSAIQEDASAREKI